MRHHFHRCGYLRVLELDVSEISGSRKGARQILEELCDAKRLAPCLGLADCDVLSAAQKRELLGARATWLRQEEGGLSPRADVRDPRAAELEALRRELLEERNAIAQENRLRAASVSVVDDDDLRALRAGRLDAIDRALDALARGRFGDCARCGAPIETSRLRQAPDTWVCHLCALAARPAVAFASSSEAPPVRVH